MLTHPLYDKHLSEWQRYRLSYEGGDEYLSAYLWKHKKEPDEYYKDRLKRAVYPNHVRAIIDTYAAHLYREPIPRSADSDVLDEFWSDMDLKGTPADEFYEEVGQLVQRGGRTAVVVDRWDPDGGTAETRAQEREAGRRPYTYAVDTEDIVDWDVDRLGRLNWIAIREEQDIEREFGTEHPGEEYQYRVWTREGWILFREVTTENDKGEEETKLVEADKGTHPVGEVPVVVAYWGKRHGRQLIAESAIKGLAKQNIRLTNLKSLIDEQIYAHVFNIMAVPRSTYDSLGEVDFSTYGAIPFDDDVTNTPYYMGPDVAQLEGIQRQIDETKTEIRHLSGLGRVNDDVKHVQSGIALSYMTADKDALLGGFASKMSRVEAKVDDFALRWMEKSATDVSREYPKDFDPGDIKDSLDAALKFASLGISGEAAIENAVLAARDRLGDRVDPERLQEIEQDLRERMNSSQLNSRTAPSLRGVG